MYANVEQLANELGIKQTRSPRDSQLWECWADRVLQADMHRRRNEPYNKKLMIRDANAYAI